MRLIKFTFIALLFTSFCSAQDDVELKTVVDTILNPKRTLQVADPLNAVKTMQKLFPGKFYKLDNDNVFLSWKCQSCKTQLYTDVNGMEEDQPFPYKEGVATRHLETITYKDSKENQFKLVFFNHSVYDPDGAQTGRFVGGLIGVAKFAKNDKIWQMRSFQPAIAAFGAFSRAPTPKLVQIGEDQYAFTIVHSNGGAGGAYSGYFYLVAGFDGKYQPLIEVPNYQITNSDSSTWSGSYTVVNDGKKKFFRDFIITTKGYYSKSKGGEYDYEIDMPTEVSELAKTKKYFDFTIEKRLSFNGKIYTVVGKPIVKYSNIK
ncbi:glycoside hydrolase family 68 protein [Flavobacterium hercynium]|uniref:Uncharacterized protein n=1 Tax=Flavobacterium hercynium TaxID=387094 RepID=A0A226H381_9FLAO|nr:glycoside hydrolase family 68 protein [Flavobacterium hercynium]OXA88338.1 hypothetical protein B0A66_15475 [Flavobacterium hercynium]SMP30540.1 Levansucrase/Invertase [Flavobacterium hercynium]